jgi:NADP-dependent 3-hydroxy acid dehydrogenase YdfG
VPECNNSGVGCCATKFAVRAVSEGLRQEAAPYNIRSTIISLGQTATDLPSSVTDEAAVAAAREQHSMAIPVLSVAHAIAFAISRPAEVDVNEIILRLAAIS